MSNRRIERVCALVKRELGVILQQINLADCGFVTVTDVRINPDLHDGHVYVSVIGSRDQQQRALEKLDREHGRIQHELAHRVVLKYTPRLQFHLDTTEAEAQRIEHLLDELDEKEAHE